MLCHKKCGMDLSMLLWPLALLAAIGIVVSLKDTKPCRRMMKKAHRMGKKLEDAIDEIM